MSLGVKAHSLAELRPLRRALQEAAAQQAAQAQAQREAQQRAQRERHLFAHTVGAVQPLKSAAAHNRHLPPPSAPEPLPLQRLQDEQRVLHEAMSDEFDVSTLLDVDDQLSFRRPGIGQDVTRKLRAGCWSIQRQLDLHGLRRDEAREALGQFIRLSHRTGVRCVRIVHGKGLGSPQKLSVLRQLLRGWLAQRQEVLAYCQAKPQDGGEGALLVLLRAARQ